MLNKYGRTLMFMCMQMLCTGQFWEKLQANEPQPDDAQLISSLEGIHITGSGSSPEVENSGIYFQNFDLPGLEYALSQELSTFLHRPLTEQGLLCIKETIARFFEGHGHPVVIVLVPEQEVTNQQLRVQVIESRLGQVRVCQNRWFKSGNLTDQVRLCQDQPIDSKVLAEDLRWLNRNPFREIDAIFIPRVQPYTTDVELLRPWTAFPCASTQEPNTTPEFPSRDVRAMSPVYRRAISSTWTMSSPTSFHRGTTTMNSIPTFFNIPVPFLGAMF